MAATKLVLFLLCLLGVFLVACSAGAFAQDYYEGKMVYPVLALQTSPVVYFDPSAHTLKQVDTQGTATPLLTCEEWEPKPKGCKIPDGMTLDDLVSVALDAQRENSRIESERFNECYAGLNHAIEALDRIAHPAKKQK